MWTWLLSAISLGSLGAAPAAGPTAWPMGDDLQVGASKAQAIVATGATLACSPAPAGDLPLRGGEICRGELDAMPVALLIAVDPAGVSRVIAYTVRGGAMRFDALSQSLPQKLGSPTRRTINGWGQNLTWLHAARQVSLRSDCAPSQPCLEVSHDATARRIARGAGLFVAATPGT